MVKETKEFVKIDITGLMKAIWRKLWLALLAAILCGAAAKLYTTTLTVEPLYRSTASLYFASGSNSILTSYNNIVVCRPVLEKVIEDMNLDLTVSDLKALVSSSTITGTYMIRVTAAFYDQATAQAILEDLITVASAYAIEVIGMDAPTVFDSPTLPVNPYNVYDNSTKYIVYGAVGGFALVIVIVMLLYIFDNKIRNEKQISWRIGTKVVGVLPRDLKKKKNVDGAMQHLYSEVIAINNNAKVVTFSECTSEKNSSLVSAFASYAAGLGKKVVEVDTDMMVYPKKENASEKNKKRTLLEYLSSSDTSIGGMIESNETFNLIEAGVGQVNAYELLSSSKYLDLIEDLKKKYDLVIINTSPLDRSICAKATVKTTDVFILSCKLGKVKAADLDYAADLLEKRMDGVVITNIRVSNGGEFDRTWGRYIDKLGD